MFKKIITALVATSILSAPAFAQDSQIGTTNISAEDANRAIELDQDCRAQLAKQYPSWFKNVLLTAVRNAPGAAVSGYFGAKAAGFIFQGGPSAMGYGKNAAISVAGGSIGAGITGYEMGKHTGRANCMDNFIRKAGHDGNPGLQDVSVIYNSFQVNGHAVRGPDGHPIGKGDYFLVVYHRKTPIETQDDTSANSGEQDQGSNIAPPAPPAQ